MTASSLSLMGARARERMRGRRLFGRGGLAIIAVLQMLMLLTPPFGGRALAEERIKGDVKITTDGGYARLAFRFEKEVPATIQHTYPIMVVAFKKPVAIAVDKLNAIASELYQRRARRPRRHVDPHRAGAQSEGQFDTRRRTALCRSVAGNLERTAARSAAGGGRGSRQARARGRAPAAPATDRRQDPEAVGDPRQGRDPADLHPLCLRDAGHGECRARKLRRKADARIRPGDQMGSGGCQGGDAADAAIDRCRRRGGFGRRQLLVQRHAGGAYLPRGPQHRGRCRPRQRQAQCGGGER